MRHERAVPRQARSSRRSTGTSSYQHNGADFYDLFGPVERSLRGRFGHRRLQQDDRSTTRRASSTCSARLPSTRASNAAERAEHRQPEEHRLARGRRQIHQHPQVPRRRRPRKRHRLARARRRSITRRATPSPSSTAASITACRCRSPNSSVWVYAHGGIAGGERVEPAGRLLLRRVPQQLRR